MLQLSKAGGVARGPRLATSYHPSLFPLPSTPLRHKADLHSNRGDKLIQGRSPRRLQIVSAPAAGTESLIGELNFISGVCTMGLTLRTAFTSVIVFKAADKYGFRPISDYCIAVAAGGVIGGASGLFLWWGLSLLAHGLAFDQISFLEYLVSGALVAKAFFDVGEVVTVVSAVCGGLVHSIEWTRK